jgi:single-strand DNA-binding protein
MASYNRIVMVGNLTRDPEYKQLASGQAVCRLGLASNRQFKNKQTGSMVQEVCYIDIDVWGPQAESCRQYLQKGRPVLVEGRLKLDSWEDQNGNARSKHSIVADRVVFLGSNVADEEVSTPSDFATKSAPDRRQSAPRAEAPRSTLSEAAGVSRDEAEQLEQNLLDQIDSIKQKSKKFVQPAKKVVRPGESSLRKQDGDEDEEGSGETAFKDQPPFEDDLPF